MPIISVCQAIHQGFAGDVDFLPSSLSQVIGTLDSTIIT
ncbi:hypothetical protein LINPERPRIM_LOCUS13812, partial [Linum perenne]